MVEIDRVMIEDLHIELVQMMENAGRNLARLVLDDLRPASAVVVAGSGGNGGGGLVAARHLANVGVKTTVVTTRSRQQLSPVVAHQLDIVDRMGLSVSADVVDADVIVDAVIGYSLRGPARGRSEELIDQIGQVGGRSSRPVVSLDTPSGLDVTTGIAPGVAVSADRTMTLCLPKIGLRSAPQVGRLFLADISVPRSVTKPYGQAAGVDPPPFRAGSILRVTDR